MNDEWEVGDVVVLKMKRGPQMTIARVNEITVVCVWFDQHDHLRQLTINGAALFKVDDV